MPLSAASLRRQVLSPVVRKACVGERRVAAYINWKVFPANRRERSAAYAFSTSRIS